MIGSSLSLELPASPKGEPPRRLPILPAGSVVRGKDGRAWRSMTTELLARLRGRTVILDENHASYLGLPGQANAGAPAPAMARMRDFSVDESGALWANDVEWTSVGRERFDGGAYLSLSPVIIYDPSTKTEDVLGDVADIHSVGLVNQPNLTMPALNCMVFNMEPNATPEPKKPAATPETPEPTAESLGAVFATALATALKPITDQLSELAAKVATAPAPVAANAAAPTAEHVTACNAAHARFVAAGKLPPTPDAKAMFMAQARTPAELATATAYYDNAPAIVALNAADIPSPNGSTGSKPEITTDQQRLMDRLGWKAEDLYPEAK